jgi:hypothetical protein
MALTKRAAEATQIAIPFVLADAESITPSLATLQARIITDRHQPTSWAGVLAVYLNNPPTRPKGATPKKFVGRRGRSGPVFSNARCGSVIESERSELRPPPKPLRESTRAARREMLAVAVRNTVSGALR